MSLESKKGMLYGIESWTVSSDNEEAKEMCTEKCRKFYGDSL